MTVRSSVTRFAELRRGLPLVAAGLLLVALVLPMWRITLEAPQYTRSLVIEVYAFPHMTGDVSEVYALNQYVGFHYPDPVYVEPNFEVHENSIKAPEWVLGPLGFLLVAAAGIFVALAPTVRKLKLGLTCQIVGTIAVFTVMFAIIQYRLHQAGHSLDPDAPLVGLSEFTPPVLGSYEVANINGFAWLGPGGYLTIVAVGLMVLAFLFRDSEATFGDIPALVKKSPGLIRRRAVSLRSEPADAVNRREPAGEENSTSSQSTEKHID